MVLGSKLRSWLASEPGNEKSAATAPSSELVERTLRQFDLQQSLTTEAEAAALVRHDPNDARGCCVLGYAALAHGHYDEAEAWFTRASSVFDCAWGHLGTALVQAH